MFFNLIMVSNSIMVAEVLENIFEQDCYRKIQTVPGCKFVNLHIRKVLLKSNTIFHHSHIPIKVVLVEQLMQTIRLLISRYCTLKNNTAFIHGLDKIMLNYNQHPHQSLSNFTSLEVHLEGS